MLVKNFHDLPKELQCEEVCPYFEILNQQAFYVKVFLIALWPQECSLY